MQVLGPPTEFLIQEFRGQGEVKLGTSMLKNYAGDTDVASWGLTSPHFLEVFLLSYMYLPIPLPMSRLPTQATSSAMAGRQVYIYLRLKNVL